jgi:hypothetical protein
VDDIEQRETALACSRLNRRKEQLTTDALQLLVDANRTGVEVDVFPAETERFAAPASALSIHSWPC